MKAIIFNNRLSGIHIPSDLPPIGYVPQLPRLELAGKLPRILIPTFPVELNTDFLTMNGDFVTINGERIQF